ncbi:hypothetical protein AB1Y20_017285 [Prymnesium parvum]
MAGGGDDLLAAQLLCAREQIDARLEGLRVARPKRLEPPPQREGEGLPLLRERELFAKLEAQQAELDALHAKLATLEHAAQLSSKADATPSSAPPCPPSPDDNLDAEARRGMSVEAAYEDMLRSLPPAARGSYRDFDLHSCGRVHQPGRSACWAWMNDSKAWMNDSTAWMVDSTLIPAGNVSAHLRGSRDKMRSCFGGLQSQWEGLS